VVKIELHHFFTETRKRPGDKNSTVIEIPTTTGASHSVGPGLDRVSVDDGTYLRTDHGCVVMVTGGFFRWVIG